MYDMYLLLKNVYEFLEKLRFKLIIKLQSVKFRAVIKSYPKNFNIWYDELHVYNFPTYYFRLLFNPKWITYENSDELKA